MLFVLFLVSYGYFFQGGGWNQNSRICLTRAIIHHRTFTIDQCREDVGDLKFANTGDWAFYNGHYYSNKAPGLSFIAIPSFAVAEYLSGFFFLPGSEKHMLFSVYMSTLCTTVLFSSLLCLLMFHIFNHFFRMNSNMCVLLTLCFGFGTLAFSYSTTFYAHQPSAFCSLLSFVLILHIRHGKVARKGIISLFAGFAAASAVVLEPSTLFILVAVLLYAMSCRESRRYIIPFLAGCVPAGVVQGFYNVTCFDYPLSLSYQYSNELVMWQVNGTLFGIPSPQRLFQLLFSPYRGLFFTSPIFLMALPGSFLFFKNKRWRPELLFCLGVSLFFIIFIAGFHGWHGGWAAGPRYLLPAFPWFFLLTGFSLTRFPKIFKVIGLVSVLINLSITIVGNEIPLEVKNPLAEVVLKSLIAGSIAINPVPLSHFEDYNMNDLVRIDAWEANFNSFNLGELLFPNSLASIFPLMCFWIIWGYWWRRFFRTLE